MTSTPVAIGSSVPACPTRRVPASLRIRATTSCEVSPDGLSTITSPLGTPPAPPAPLTACSLTEPLPQARDGLGGRAAGGEAGRLGVAAAAQRGAGPAHVD